MSVKVANYFSLSIIFSLLSSRLAVPSASKATVTDLSLNVCVQSFPLPVVNFDWLALQHDFRIT